MSKHEEKLTDSDGCLLGRADVEGFIDGSILAEGTSDGVIEGASLGTKLVEGTSDGAIEGASLGTIEVDG